MLREAMESNEDETNADPALFTSLLSSQGRDGCHRFMHLIEEAEKEVELHSEDRPASWAGTLIVLEGLDGVGKTTTSNALVASINSSVSPTACGFPSDAGDGEKGVHQSASLLRTPPASLSSFRDTFDRLEDSPLLRRAYYTLGNILTSKRIRTSDEKSMFVLDRFWSSTYAYQVATDLSSQSSSYQQRTNDGDEGEVTSAIQWPWYLVKPTLLVLLVVQESIRIQRIQSREETLTAEEDMLKRKQLFRELVLSLYRCMPDVVEIDNANPTEETVYAILGHLTSSNQHQRLATYTSTS